jgi:hypothetical protein
MRPSIGSGMQGALHSGSTPLVVHVSKPQPEPTAEAADRDEAAPSHEAKD